MLRLLDPLITQGVLELVELDHARAVVVKAVEEGVHLCLGYSVPQRRDRLAKLLLVERAVAVVIPLTEQIDQLDAMLGENAPKLLLHAQISRGVQLDHRRQHRRASDDVVGVGVLGSHGASTLLVLTARRALQIALRRLGPSALAQHLIQLTILQ